MPFFSWYNASHRLNIQLITLLETVTKYQKNNQIKTEGIQGLPVQINAVCADKGIMAGEKRLVYGAKAELREFWGVRWLFKPFLFSISLDPSCEATAFLLCFTS